MHEICATMVARVFELEVELGDTVEKGDVLALLESMKMEIPILSDVTGTVSDIRKGVGDSVAEGDVLFVIDA